MILHSLQCDFNASVHCVVNTAACVAELFNVLQH
jgi:hypothetical protein